MYRITLQRCLRFSRFGPTVPIRPQQSSYHELILLVHRIPLGFESVQEIVALPLSHLFEPFVIVADLTGTKHEQGLRRESIELAI